MQCLHSQSFGCEKYHSYNPTNKQKQQALAEEIQLQLETLTKELDEKVNNIKILTKELIKTL
jgi:hypothetical protein